MIDRVRAFLALAWPGVVAAWPTTLTLGAGVAAMLCAIAAFRGIPDGAVATEHRGLLIVGRPGVLESADALVSSGPGPISTADLLAWRSLPALAGLQAAERLEAILTLDDGSRVVRVWRATAGLPALLGANQPIAGRVPGRTPSVDGEPLELALGELVARAWFGSADAAVGRVGRLDGRTIEIVGVMPEPPGQAFAGIDAWMIFEPDALAARGADDPDLGVATMIGIMRSSAHEPERTRPADGGGITESSMAAVGAVAEPIQRVVLGSVIIASLRLALGSATAMLLGSMATTAALWTTVMIRRREELALRVSLGSGRMPLVGEALARAALMGALALAVGALAAWWATDLARQGLAGTIPGGEGLSMARVPWWACVGLLASASLPIACAGIWAAVRADPSWCVRGMPAVRAARWATLGAWSVGLHTAVAALAIAASIALGRAAWRADPASGAPQGLSLGSAGADPDAGGGPVAILPIALPWWRLDDADRWAAARALVESAAERLGELASAVGVVDHAPIVGPEFRAIPVRARVPSERVGDRAVVARLRSATPGAIAALGVRESAALRDEAVSALLGMGDGPLPALPVAISGSLATELFGADGLDPGGDDRSVALALGGLVLLGDERVPALVRAVLDDVADGPDPLDSGGPGVWLPMPIGWDGPSCSLVVRLREHAPSGGGARLEAERIARSALSSIVPDAAASPAVWLDDRVRERARIYWVLAAIGAASAGAAGGLAAIAGVAAARLAMAVRMDELRLRSAFGVGGVAVTWRALAPVGLALLGGAFAAPMVSLLFAAGIPGSIELPRSPSALAAPFMVGSLSALAVAAISAALATRLLRIDPAALLRSL